MPAITLAQEAEFPAVRRFWYHVFCEIRGVLREKADHATRELDDPLLSRGLLYLARDDKGICGTLLSTYTRATDVEPYASFYELDRLPEYPRHTAIATKFMTRPDVRGTLVAFQLLRAAVQRGLQDDIAVAVFDCNEPVYELFCGVGAQSHAGWKVHPDFGRVCVMKQVLRRTEEVLAAAPKPKHRLLREQ